MTQSSPQLELVLTTDSKQSSFYLHQSYSFNTPFFQLVGKLQEKWDVLPASHKRALSADPDDIMYTTPGDVGIYYDDDGERQRCEEHQKKLLI